MAAVEFLAIKNWDTFQHYSKRNPPWIKLHRAILDDYAFCALPDAAKGHLMMLWLYGSQNDGILKHAGSTFNGSRIAALEAQAMEPAFEEHRARLKGVGEFLLDMASTFDSVTTLTQRCEILGVNVADRGALTEEDGLVRIFNAHGLEDSAYHRNRGWKSGPLHESTVEIFIDFMLNTMEGRKLGDSLFEPGGLFEDVPLYRREQDGTMVRQPPRLRVVASEASSTNQNQGKP